jgi:EAL domain-containing protein (putative c-di-GMP-specific phosphodiesterase class I)
MFEALNKPYQLADSQISCGASMGITFFGEQYEETLEPLKRAELAMYQAKAAGRNMLRFFEPQMQAVISARAKLEAALREAIQKQQFTLHYQAQVSDNEGIIGVEALVRWHDPKRGMVSPAEFIGFAEETGLILPIGSWVLETACQQLAVWAGQPAMAHLSMAVNVSAQQFRESSFVAQVLSTLERTGANAKRLKLELTESVLIADAEDVIMKMNALKAIGIGFAIDDFGTGYSSLSYLKRLPLERLKIDQGFVRNILMDPDDAAISRAVIAMATSMGLGVIAEGVETEAQREFLADMGCHTYQGYLFSRPLPVADFEALVQRA